MVQVTEYHEKVKLAMDRLEYAHNMKIWLDGYIDMQTARQLDREVIDERKLAVARGLRRRFSELIMRDAVYVASFDVEGKEAWQAPTSA